MKLLYNEWTLIIELLEMEKIGCRHVGYVIGGLWLNVYEIRPMRKEV